MYYRCSDEFGGRATKPRFLEQLQSYLKSELTALDTLSPKLQERKLQVYQEVFDSLIEEFTTYKPLLSTIKNEYDITLAYLQEQIRELKPLRSQLVLLSEQCDKKVLELRKNERAEIRALKQERQHFQQVIEGMREQQRALETQVYHLQEELAAQYLQYRDECDARKLLIAKISKVQSEDPVTVKLALKVCREDLTRAQVELNRLHAEYGEVVPHRDWENLDHMYKENLLQVSLQKDNLQRELDVFQKASTPRPHWEQCADVLGGRERWSEIFEGQSSKKRLEVLLEELNSMGMEQKDFFPGMGTSSNVPIYLRYEGQLKNLRLNKADVVRIIKDIWREKAFEDEKEFLHQYMQRQYGGQAGEWIYSLMHCINCNLKDDFISLFYDILTDKVGVST
uniref:Translin-associated factor X-interacting protein 1 N-terminal domain-containing protein n=1 Tax=Astyanax mexicanus TaxID=7994 RepID=A0A8B9LJ69_ASTMX